MSEVTHIAWTDHTFNPWWGCVKVSPGCANCYAEALADRMGKYGLWGKEGGPRRHLSAKYWNEPRKWNAKATRRERVFCGSMCDVFEKHSGVALLREAMWHLIEETPNLDWQLLTKRPENIRQNLPWRWGAGWPNVWIGTTVESMAQSSRVVTLREIPAVVRFISYEPALGPLDEIRLDGIDWVIYAGESGPHHRKDDINWARRMRTHCKAHGVSFFYKQAAGLRPQHEAKMDGEVVREWPKEKP